ncbi:hypothetical protein [Mesotoga sp.]|uniref:hypothetical protein n=1 Tax=Mesotoga sp. TaxID=2053577 RepID=UPI00345E3D9C
MNIATRAAQTIFMYSFSGGREHGATLTDIKRQAAAYDNPGRKRFPIVGTFEEQALLSPKIPTTNTSSATSRI